MLTSYPIGRVCTGQLVRNECLKGELDEAPLAWSPYVPPIPPTGSSGIKSLGAAILPDGGPHLLWSSGRNEMSTRMPLNKTRVHARTKRPPRYRRAANEAFKRALEAQYGSQGAASPVRRIDPKTGLAVAGFSSAENIRQSLGPNWQRDCKKHICRLANDVAGVRLQFSKQKQDQQDYDYKSKPAAAIVTGAVERTAANAAEAAE